MLLAIETNGFWEVLHKTSTLLQLPSSGLVNNSVNITTPCLSHLLVASADYGDASLVLCYDHDGNV